jgi:hypothetical protein
LIYVDADGAPEQRVRLAARLADKFNATFIGMSALSIRPAIVADVVRSGHDASRDQEDEGEARGPAKLVSRHRWRGSLQARNSVIGSGTRAPRKIDFSANRGPFWSERLRIGAGTKPNHSGAIWWRVIGGAYFSRCPQ